MLHLNLEAEILLHRWSVSATLVFVFLCSGCDKDSAGIDPPDSPPQQVRSVPGERPSKTKDKRSRYGAKPDQRPVKLRSGNREILGSGLSEEQLKRIQAYQHRNTEAGERDHANLDEPVSVLVERYAATTDPHEQLEMIHGLAGTADERGLDLLVREALEAESPDLRVAALEALAETPRKHHLSAVAAALSAEDPNVQAAGVWLLSHIQADAAIPLWRQVISGSSPDLTQLAFDRLPEAPEAIQVAVASSGLSSPQPWIVEHSLLTLGGLNTKSAVEALIPAIDHVQSGDLAQDGLMFLTGQFFSSSAEAQQWWQKNRDTLAPDLQPLELNLPSDPERPQKTKK